MGENTLKEDPNQEAEVQEETNNTFLKIVKQIISNSETPALISLACAALMQQLQYCVHFTWKPSTQDAADLRLGRILKSVNFIDR